MDLLRPKSHFELWMTLAMEDIRQFVPCPIQLATIKIPSSGLEAISTNLSDEFDGFILATVDCEIADVLALSTRTPILRLDLAVCQRTPDIKHLPIYRFDASYAIPVRYL